MVVFPLRCVTDANILFNVYHGGIAKEFFSLPFQILASNILLSELIRPSEKELMDLGLIPYDLPGTWMLEIYNLVPQNGKLSIQDISGYVLAKNLDCTLLSQDRRLSNLARCSGIDVKGTTWVIDQMIECGIITSSQAIGAISEMEQNNRHIPKKELEEARVRWENSEMK